MTAQQVINFAGIGKSFRHDFTGSEVVALRDLSFSVDRGEVFGIIGPNGAGKSTTLKILMGFIAATAGSAGIFGRPPSDSSVHQHIGYLPENPSLYENLTVVDHLYFAARTTNFRGSVAARVEEILARVDLAQVAKLPIRRFSKGMTQRAALAYALFHEPELLVLDEPMSGLDPLGRQLVVDIIRDYHARGHTIIFCSHILTDVERICDRIAIMNHGELQTIATPDQLQNYAIPPELPKTTSPLEAFFLEILKQGEVRR